MSAMAPTPLRPDAPAMPELKKLSRDRINNFDVDSTNGLSARQYAAIHLCVPDSGTEWLDKMIERRMRHDLAVSLAPKAELPSIYADPINWERIANYCLRAADAIIAAEKTGGAA